LAYQHRNRRGDIYLLQAGKTATGKPRYYFGRKLTGTAVEEIPEGYEVYESPERAQVYLRKLRPTAIANVERDIVVDGMRRLAPIEHFIVDVESDCLVVYSPGIEIREANRIISSLAGPNMLLAPRVQEVRDQLIARSDYVKAFRFGLVDEEKRLFAVQRWCFRGMNEHWIFLSGPASLSDLVEMCAEHLGSESFFELM
jgi:hypothetical protein